MTDLISQERQEMFIDRLKDLEKLLTFWQTNVSYQIVKTETKCSVRTSQNTNEKPTYLILCKNESDVTRVKTELKSTGSTLKCADINTYNIADSRELT